MITPMRFPVFAILCALFASTLTAHPFDEVTPSVFVRVNPFQKSIEVEYNFEYRTIAASLSEQQNSTLGLDANRDGRITLQEQEERVAQYVEEVRNNAVLALNTTQLKLEGNPRKSQVLNLDLPGVEIEVVGDWKVGYRLFLIARDVHFKPGRNEVSFHNAEKRIQRSTSMGDRMRAFVLTKDPHSGEYDYREPIDSQLSVVDGLFDRLTCWLELPAQDNEPDPLETAAPPTRSSLSPTNPPEQSSNEQTESKLRELLTDIKSGGSAMLIALLVLFVYGMWHAIQPGHGKTLVASYLISTRGKPRDALTLGITVTLAHTSGVFVLLGIWYLLEQFYPELGSARSQTAQDILLISLGGVIFMMGLGMLLKRGKKAGHHHDIFGRHVGEEHSHNHSHTHDEHGHTHSHSHSHDEHDHAHSHEHSHSESHTHTHTEHSAHAHHHDHAHHHHHEHDPGSMTTWQVIRLGIIGGMLPCPTAFALALLTIVAGEALLGVALVFVFSLGLASVLSLIGFMMVMTRSYLQKRHKEGGRIYRLFENYVPTLGALAITLIGFVLVMAALERMELVSIRTLLT